MLGLLNLTKGQAGTTADLFTPAVTAEDTGTSLSRWRHVRSSESCSTEGCMGQLAELRVGNKHSMAFSRTDQHFTRAQ